MEELKKISESLPSPNIDKYYKRESVRTTFKLKKQSCENLIWLSKYYNISMKEVFDMFCEDDKYLKKIANLFKDAKFYEGEDTIRKTYVLSKSALTKLTEISKSISIHRDDFIDLLSMLFQMKILSKNEDIYKKHEKAYDILSSLRASFDEYEDELQEVLDDDNDVILQRFDDIVGDFDSLINDLIHESNEGILIKKE